MVAKMHGIVTL